MRYPLPLLRRDTTVAPLFADQLCGDPHVFDFSSANPKTLEMDTQNPTAWQEMIDEELRDAGCSWGIGSYLEERRTLLRNFPQMIREGRVYHLGLDIVVPAGFTLHVPLYATVERVGKEEGDGNFGGFVLLRHEIEGVSFLSLYGHLDARHIVSVGDRVKAGQTFARVGDHSDSGGWFTHTHLQILTERGIHEGWMARGYVSADYLSEIDDLAPSPYLLFRY